MIRTIHDCYDAHVLGMEGMGDMEGMDDIGGMGGMDLLSTCLFCPF